MCSSEPTTEMVKLNRCNLHRDCRVDFDIACCPQCEIALANLHAQAKMRGAMKFLKSEIDRLKNVETENTTLHSRLWELEDRLPEEDLDDPPIEEPRRREDMGSQNGTEVTPRVWGEEVDRE